MARPTPCCPPRFSTQILSGGVRVEVKQRAKQKIRHDVETALLMHDCECIQGTRVSLSGARTAVSLFSVFRDIPDPHNDGSGRLILSLRHGAESAFLMVSGECDEKVSSSLPRCRPAQMLREVFRSMHAVCRWFQRHRVN